MKYSNEQIERALQYDSLSEAERITNQPYQKDDRTSMLGLGLASRNAEAKRVMLQSRNDTHFGIQTDEFQGILTDMDFECMLHDDFRNDLHDREEYCELWVDRERAILLFFDTYGPKINSGHFYYNVRFRSDADHFQATSSGGFIGDRIWLGDHDCREGMRFNIEKLASLGEFVCPWVKQPFLWLVNFSESKGDYDHKKIYQGRIERLPQEVRELFLM